MGLGAQGIFLQVLPNLSPTLKSIALAFQQVLLLFILCFETLFCLYAVYLG